MLLSLDRQSPLPLFVQIRDQIRDQIASGILRQGERIPPTRDLATRLGVHRTTVANAYDELQAEGWIAGHVGRGTFVTEAAKPAAGNARKPEQARAGVNNGLAWSNLLVPEPAEEPLESLMPEAPRGTLSFLAARPSEAFFPVEDFRRACNTVLKREGRRLLQQGPSDGYPALKEWLQEWLREEGISVQSNQILITNGCQQALDLTAKALVRPGDAVALENPIYPGAVSVFRRAGGRLVGVPVRPDGLDLQALEMLLEQAKPKVLLLTPNYQNPTGTSLTLAVRRRILELAAAHRVAIVEDNIYGGLHLRGPAWPPLKALDKSGIVIYLNSFSKICFPGLRVGWCVAAPEVISRLRSVKQASDLHTDQLAQAALAEFGRSGQVARHLKLMRKVYRRRLEVTEGALEKQMPEGVSWTKPAGGMAVWVTLPRSLDASEILFRARERGILFAPGRLFFFQNAEPNTLRLSFAGLEDDQIRRGIALLGGLLKAEMRQRRKGRAPGRREAAVALV